MSAPHTDLSLRMLALADTGHPRAEELRTKALAFDEAVAADPFDTKRMLVCFARARLLWCDITGESLV